MASSDGETALGGIASPADADDASNAGVSDDGSSDVAECICIGCNASSRDPCPIAAIKSKGKDDSTRIKWGKWNKKLVYNRKLKKKVSRVRPSGEWCGVCINMQRVKLRLPKYLKAGDLRRNPELKKQWMSSHKENVKALAKGKQRIKEQFTTKVVKRDEQVSDIQAPKREFWELEPYRESWGSPRANKARVVKRFVIGANGKKKLAKGVYVLTGRAGVHTVNDSLRGSVGKEEHLDEGDDLQFDGQADEVAEAAEGEFADGLQMSGTLTAAETAKRAAAADAAKPTVLEEPEDASEPDSDDSDSESGEDSSCESADKATEAPTGSGSKRPRSPAKGSPTESGKDLLNISPPPKRRSLGAPSLASASPKTARSIRTGIKTANPQRRSAAAAHCHDDESTAEVNAAIKVLDSRLASMQAGEMDATKGRALLRALRDWAADVVTGRKALKKAPPELKTDLNSKIARVDKAMACLRAWAKNPLVLSDMVGALDALKLEGGMLSPGMENTLMAKRIESLLDDAKYSEALEFLKTESSEHVHRSGLLQIVKAKFPTKPLAGAPEASQQMADCKDFFNKLPLSDLAPAVAEELKPIVAITRYLSDETPFTEELREHEATILEAQTVSDGKRAADTIAAQFGLSKAGKKLLKDLSAAVLAAEKASVMNRQRESALAELDKFLSQTGQDVSNAVAEKFGVLGRAVHDNCPPDASPDVVKAIDAKFAHFVKAVFANLAKICGVGAAETAGHAPLNPSDVTEFTTILGVVKKAIQQWIEKKKALGADAGFIGEGDVSGVGCIAQALEVVINGLPDKASNQGVVSKAKCCSALLPQFEVCGSTFVSSLFRSSSAEAGPFTQGMLTACVADLSGRIKVLHEQLPQHLDALFGNECVEKLGLTKDMLSAVRTEEGNLNMESGAVTKVSGMDQAKELATIDALAGVSLVLGGFDFASSPFWKEQSASLQALALCLPPLVTLCRCQEAFGKYVAGTAGDGAANNKFAVAELRWGAVASSVDSVKDFTTFENRLKNSPLEDMDFVDKAKKFLDAKKTRCPSSSLIPSLTAGRRRHASRSMSPTPRWTISSRRRKAATRTALMQDLKEFNGSSGGGLKNFDKLVDALAAVGVKEVDGEDLVKMRAAFTESRQSARTLVAYRGAAAIITREKSGDVDGLLAELKALKVKLSRVWIKKLESLKK